MTEQQSHDKGLSLKERALQAAEGKFSRILEKVKQDVDFGTVFAMVIGCGISITGEHMLGLMVTAATNAARLMIKESVQGNLRDPENVIHLSNAVLSGVIAAYPAESLNLGVDAVKIAGGAGIDVVAFMLKNLWEVISDPKVIAGLMTGAATDVALLEMRKHRPIENINEKRKNLSKSIRKGLIGATDWTLGAGEAVIKSPLTISKAVLGLLSRVRFDIDIDLGVHLAEKKTVPARIENPKD